MRSLTLEDLAMVHEIVSTQAVEPLSDAAKAAHFELVDSIFRDERAKRDARAITSPRQLSQHFKNEALMPVSEQLLVLYIKLLSKIGYHVFDPRGKSQWRTIGETTAIKMSIGPISSLLDLSTQRTVDLNLLAKKAKGGARLKIILQEDKS